MTCTKTIVALFITLTLTACAGMRGGLGKAELDSSTKVAVASMLGNTFHGIHVGTTVFGNSYYDASVPEWKIDELTEQTIAVHLARTGSRTAMPLQHDPELAVRLEKGRSFMQGYNYGEVIDLAKKQGADTLILVQPIRYDNSPAHQPGYGFFERTFLGKSRSCVYSLFIVSVFSTDSGKRLGWEWGFPCEDGETELEWKDSFDKFSNKEMQLLRRKTEKNIEQNVMKALVELGY